MLTRTTGVLQGAPGLPHAPSSCPLFSRSSTAAELYLHRQCHPPLCLHENTFAQGFVFFTFSLSSQDPMKAGGSLIIQLEAAEGRRLLESGSPGKRLPAGQRPGDPELLEGTRAGGVYVVGAYTQEFLSPDKALGARSFGLMSYTLFPGCSASCLFSAFLELLPTQVRRTQSLDRYSQVSSP